MCNGCNWNNRSSCGCNSNCGCNCGCNQNSLWNILFGNTQRVCRDCCGNLVVTNNNSWGNGCNGCNSNCGCNCGCNNGTASASNGSGNNNAYACVSYCQSVDSSAFTGNNGCCNNSTGYNRCGCNAYSAWTQENYGE